MSYDQVAGTSSGDDASLGGASQGGRGICRAFWFLHSAFWVCEMGSQAPYNFAQQICKAILQGKFAR